VLFTVILSEFKTVALFSKKVAFCVYCRSFRLLKALHLFFMLFLPERHLLREIKMVALFKKRIVIFIKCTILGSQNMFSVIYGHFKRL